MGGAAIKLKRNELVSKETGDGLHAYAIVEENFEYLKQKYDNLNPAD